LGSVVSLTDDASKDDEERRLESLLFGTPFVPSGKKKNSVLVSSDHEDEENDGDSDGKFVAVDKELENLTDADVSGVPSMSVSHSKKFHLP
jgi:U3 small nucleolar RNA-associated protein 18